MQFDSLYS